MQKFIPLAGRTILSLIFFISGVGKIFDFTGTQQHMISYGMPFTAFFAVVVKTVLYLGASPVKAVGAVASFE